MAYILSITAFLMTVASIMGDTWNNGRPTVVGWSILGLAAVALALTVGKHYLDQKEITKISDAAKIRACRGVYGIVYPFAILLVESSVRDYMQGNISEEDANKITLTMHEFLSVPSERHLPSRFDEVLDALPTLTNYHAYLGDISLRDHAPLKQPKRDKTPTEDRIQSTWRNILEQYTDEAIGELDATLTIYRGVLNSKEITAIQELRNDWLTQRLENLDQLSDDIRLSDVLRLNETRHENIQTRIYEEFLFRVRNVVQVCSATSQTSN